ncbi:hypothetical protein MRB53_010577 [Persea americana]|uniref:Uncharacterized protein n=1 Tax=Persea americana TaxID=3435 RepID=A0ACC2LSF4_PERAE|nr:hypothetical protein MRB53_010577 [Persea americana]
MESEVKGSTFTSPTKDYPTINLREDVDVTFSSFMNAVTDVVAQHLSHKSNEVALNGLTVEAQLMPEKLNDVGLTTTSKSTRISVCPCHKIRPMERGTTKFS